MQSDVAKGSSSSESAMIWPSSRSLVLLRSVSSDVPGRDFSVLRPGRSVGPYEGRPGKCKTNTDRKRGRTPNRHGSGIGLLFEDEIASASKTMSGDATKK